MGTDIDGTFQAFKPELKKWYSVPTTVNLSRNYYLFAVLAGVRNGYGFGGIQTGEPVTPIAEPRGLPTDSGNLLITGYGDCAENPGSVWLGVHDHSWLTAEEMLAWHKNAPKVLRTGLLERQTYETWDKVSKPVSYCAGVLGGGFITVTDNEVAKRETPNWTHIRCEWTSDLAVDLAYFFDEVTRLKELYGEVRFVFGFNS